MKADPEVEIDASLPFKYLYFPSKSELEQNYCNRCQDQKNWQSFEQRIQVADGHGGITLQTQEESYDDIGLNY